MVGSNIFCGILERAMYKSYLKQRETAKNQLNVIEKLKNTPHSNTDFPFSELNLAFKKVRRKRKKMYDEEKWRRFNEEIMHSRRKVENDILQKPEVLSSEEIDESPLDLEESEKTLSEEESLLKEEELSQISSLDEEPCSVDEEKTDFVLENVKVVLENILNLIRSPPILAEDHSLEVGRQKAAELNELLENYYMAAIKSQVKKAISSDGNVRINSITKYNFQEAFVGLLRASQEIEKHLQENSQLPLIENTVFQFLNLAYSVLAIHSHIFDKKEQQKDIAMVLLKAIHVLKNKCYEKSTMTDERLPPQGQSLWLKESLALARLKFGPPNKAKGMLPSILPEKFQPGSEKDCGFLMVDRSSDTFDEDSSYHKNTMFGGNTEEKEKALKHQSCSGSSGKEKIMLNDADKSVEDALPKIIAKKIQEIPGVDAELQKVEELRLKMKSSLMNIKTFVSKNFDDCVVPLDDEYERVLHRTVEFGARFKRNYSFRTKCQLAELKNVDSNPLLIKKKSKVIVVIQKLITSHQGILQALQVIEKQLPTIAVIGLTQEVFFLFYHYIYELTFLLKPFYGFSKSEVLDDVEKVVFESVKLLKELKQEYESAKNKRSNSNTTQSKAKSKLLKDGKIVMKSKLRKKSPYANKLIKKPSKNSSAGGKSTDRAKKIKRRKVV